MKRKVFEMQNKPEIDAFDTRILAELQADARLSLAELGRRVHLSQPAVAERVRKLEAAGVITGYRATVNLAALGYGIRDLVRVGRADFERMSRFRVLAVRFGSSSLSHICATLSKQAAPISRACRVSSTSRRRS